MLELPCARASGHRTYLTTDDINNDVGAAHSVDNNATRSNHGLGLSVSAAIPQRKKDIPVSQNEIMVEGDMAKNPLSMFRIDRTRLVYCRRLGVLAMVACAIVMGVSWAFLQQQQREEEVHRQGDAGGGGVENERGVGSLVVDWEETTDVLLGSIQPTVSDILSDAVGDGIRFGVGLMDH